MENQWEMSQLEVSPTFVLFLLGLVAYVDLDERAIDALREFNEEGALTVLQQFKESDLSHVQVTPSRSYIPCSPSEKFLCWLLISNTIFLCFLSNVE